jgi:hypothetical protein
MSTEKLIEDLGEVFNSKGFMDKYGYKTPVTAYTALLRLRKLGKIRLLGGGKYRYYEVQ